LEGPSPSVANRVPPSALAVAQGLPTAQPASNQPFSVSENIRLLASGSLDYRKNIRCQDSLPAYLNKLNNQHIRNLALNIINDITNIYR
jgi:hypothetical protein